MKLWDYVNWYNHHRIHSSLGIRPLYNTGKTTLKKLSKKALTIQPLWEAVCGQWVCVQEVICGTVRERGGTYYKTEKERQKPMHIVSYGQALVTEACRNRVCQRFFEKYLPNGAFQA